MDTFGLYTVDVDSENCSLGKERHYGYITKHQKGFEMLAPVPQLLQS